MSRNLIQGRLCVEIIEPVSSNCNKVTDCFQIDLGMELYAEVVACNAKGDATRISLVGVVDDQDCG